MVVSPPRSNTNIVSCVMPQSHLLTTGTSKATANSAAATSTPSVAAPPLPPPPKGKWFGRCSKDHAHYMLRYQLDSNGMCENLREDEVDQVCGSFQSMWSEQEAADKEAQWRAALQLHETMLASSKASARSMTVATTGKLGEHCYRLEQNGRYISRANFSQCVRQVLGGGTRSTKSLIDCVFSAFDPRNRNQVDWRTVLFTVYSAATPLQSCRDMVWNAFRFYIGEAGDVLDCPLSGGAGIVRLSDLKTVLSPLVRVDAMSTVLARFDDAWVNVASQVASTGGVVDEKHSLVATPLLTLSLFEHILDDPSIQSLIEKTIVVGHGGESSALDFNLCAFECQCYPPTLLKHVKKSRRALAITKFVRDLDMTQMKAAMFEWKLFCSRRRHARELVDALTHRLWHKQATRGFLTLHRWAMRQVAAVEIQRVSRGFLGRIDAGVRHVFTYSSTLLQSFARKFLQRCRYQHVCQSRKEASISIQRILRGNRDRRIAISTMLAMIEKERSELEEEKKRFEHHRRTCAAIVIQRLHRSCSSRQETRRRLRREAKAREQLEEDRMRFRRERRIFERELKECYDTKKREKEAACASTARSDQERIRIRNLQRRIMREDLNRAMGVKSALDMRNEQQDAARHQDDWSALIESKAKKYEEYCLHCLQDPRSAKERKMRAPLARKIKKRMPYVLKRADTQGLQMEIVEAKQIATKEILELEASKEKDRITEQWHLDRLERTKQRKMCRENDIRLAREKRGMNEQRASLLLARAHERWSARKVLRKLCIERFEKEFDVEHHAFHYVDRRTGEKTWEKPKALGKYDIPTKNEWKVLRDAQDFPYYYNPCTLEMSWQPPPGAAMCQTTVPQPWLREYPVPFGPCEYFAANDNRFCEQCTLVHVYM